MVDFSNTDIQVLPSAVTPPQPVADNSAVIATQGAADAIGNAFNILGGTIKGFRQRSAEEAQGKAIGGFINELGRIDAAEQQGSITPAAAAARRRTALVTNVANNPTMAGEFRSTFTSLSGKSRFGEDTPETQARNKLVEDAFTQGFIDDGMTDEQRALGLENFKAVTAEMSNIKREQDKLSFLKQQQDTEKSTIQLQETKYNMAIKRSLPALGDSFYSQTNIRVSQILDSLNTAGGSPESQQQAVRLLQKLKSDVAQQMTAFGAGADSDTRGAISSIAEPINQSIDDALEVANGNMSRDVYNNAVKTNANKSLLNLATGEPRLWNIIALSEVSSDLANIVAVRSGGLQGNLVDMIGNSANPDITYNDGGRQYYEGLQQTQNRINNGLVRSDRMDGAKAEVVERNNGVVTSLANNGSRYTSATELNVTVDHLASPEFAEFVKTGQLNPQEAERAKGVLQSSYLNELMPLMKQALNQDPFEFMGSLATMTRAGPQLGIGGEGLFHEWQPLELGSVSDLVTFSFTKNGVVFAPKDPSDSFAQEASRKLNKELAPLLNKTTRATAHLGGDVNYEQVFNEVIAPQVGLETSDAPTEEQPTEEQPSSGQPEGDTPDQVVGNIRVFGEESTGENAGLEVGTSATGTAEAGAGVGAEASSVKELGAALQEPFEVPLGDTPTEGEEGSQEAPEAPPELNLTESVQKQQQSDAEILKAAREKLLNQGIDEGSAQWNAFISREYRMAKRKQGEQVSKAAQAHAKAKPGSEPKGAGAKIPKGEVVAYVGQGLVDRGLPQHVAEGFLLNFQDESGFNPGINERNPILPGSRGGFGLYQLTGPRRRQYEAYAKALGLPVDSIDAQLDFLMWELENSESKAAERILRASTRAEAAEAIVEHFLRPAKSHREARKRKYRNS